MRRFADEIEKKVSSQVSTAPSSYNPNIPPSFQGAKQEDIPGPSVYGDPKKTPKIQDYAKMTYKKLPLYISHFNPKSKDYIPSERDERHNFVPVESYNYLIDRLKGDIKLQEEVDKYLASQARPWLDGQSRAGIDANVFKDGVKNYTKDPLTGVEIDDHENHVLKKHTRNRDRFLSDTIYYPKYARLPHIEEWERELENRPVNPDYHRDKGYKFDVATPYEQRFPHVADRLGYPETLGSPTERLFRLESDIYHPNYLDQPFVQIPKPEPHPSLNFEEGEVIYENLKLIEWAKLWSRLTLGALSFLGVFAPYSLFYKTHASLKCAMDGYFLHYYNHTMYFWDSMQLHILFAGAGVYYLLYLSATVLQQNFRQYVVKMTYNKDKELIFVTKLTAYGGLVGSLHFL